MDMHEQQDGTHVAVQQAKACGLEQPGCERRGADAVALNTITCRESGEGRV